MYLLVKLHSKQIVQKILLFKRVVHKSLKTLIHRNKSIADKVLKKIHETIEKYSNLISAD